MSEELKNGRYENKYGDIYWCKDGQYHRENGPAVEYLDGPAIEYADGEKHWFINDVELTEKEFNVWLAKKQLNERLTEQLEDKPTGKRIKI